jgi:CheY-like chemotaxis protein
MESSVLIIDDEPVAREALLALLSLDDYHLEFAENGVEGLAKAAQLQPDVILLDVMMPGMDGFETCRQLRADSLLAEVPIVMITALDDRASKITGIEAGADDFVSKPFDRAELRARLRAITRLNRYRRMQVERSRLAWMLEQAQDGYLILSTDDTILYANPSARLYLGMPEHGDLQSPKFLETVCQQYQLNPDVAWEGWPAAIIEGPCYLIRPESETANAFWLQASLLPSGSDGVFGRLLQLRNVTEHIAAKQNIQKFHSFVEYKFHIPLSLAQMSLDLLLTRLAKQQMTELISLARNVYEEVSLLQSEIDEVLRYLSAPTKSAQGSGYKAERLLIRAPIIGAELGLENIQVSLPPELRETRLTLTQPAMDMILLELFGSARKFHPQHAPTVEITVTSLNAQEILISVQDDGTNLSPQQLAWIMTPYLQIEKDFTEKASGMGLALPLVGAIVWQVGGKVSLRNRLGQAGVIVDLVLPIDRQEP